MKELVTLVTSVPKDKTSSGWQELVKSNVKHLRPTKVETSPFGMVMEFLFDYYPEQLEELVQTLKGLGISASVYVRRDYEPEELLNSEFLELRTQLEVDSVIGTLQWDLLPVCRYCRFKETQWILPMIRIKSRSRGYQLANVDYHPKIVSSLLADELKKAVCTGVKLIPLGAGAVPDWFAMDILHELPPMQSLPTRLKLSSATRLCTPNHNLGQTNSEFFYLRRGFDAKDFNRTYEVFGDSESTERGLIISNRVYRLLMKLGVERLVCEPIRLLD